MSLDFGHDCLCGGPRDESPMISDVAGSAFYRLDLKGPRSESEAVTAS